MANENIMDVSVPLENLSKITAPTNADIKAGNVIHRNSEGEWVLGAAGINWFALNNASDLDAGGSGAFGPQLIHAGETLITGLSGKADAQFTIPVDSTTGFAVGAAVYSAAGILTASSGGDTNPLAGYVEEVLDDAVVITPVAGA